MDELKIAAGIASEQPRKRGFALISPERRREIASMGGKAAHRKGTAHQFTSEEAREAVKRRKQAAAEKAPSP